MDFENNCVTTNKIRPILSAAIIFSVDSSFWLYKVYADIRGRSSNFYENFRQTYVYLSPYVVLVIVNSKNSYVMTWTIPG